MSFPVPSKEDPEIHFIPGLYRFSVQKDNQNISVRIGDQMVKLLNDHDNVITIAALTTPVVELFMCRMNQ